MSCASPASSSETPREDPSRLTKEELTTRGAETVVALGTIARLVAKQSVSAPLQSTISTFADYEKTLGSTEEMLKKTMKGMSDMCDLARTCCLARTCYLARTCRRKVPEGASD